MKITIHSISNGAYAVFDNETTEGLPDVDIQAYPFDDAGQDDYKIALLRDIAESLFPSTSRYDKKRVEVRFVHGDKAECDGCEVCKP